MQPLEILQALYASEINVRIESFWDGGWTAVLGDEMNGFPWARVRASTLEECLTELANQAVSVYPDSNFANVYRASKFAR
jgi:hypothetical protein